MRVKLRTSMLVAGAPRFPGEVVEMDFKNALGLLALGMAVPVRSLAAENTALSLRQKENTALCAPGASALGGGAPRSFGRS